MNRIEQLKEDLALIREEAARRELARKQAQQKAVIEARCKLEADLVECRQINENWLLVKPWVLNFFQELKSNVLTGRGKIVGWEKKNTGYHHHSYYSHGGREGNEIMTYSYWASGEFAELQITNLGRIVVFKPIEYQRGGCDDRKFSTVPGAERRIYAGILSGVVTMDESGRFHQPKYPYALPCPECENVSGLPLTPPLDEITEQLKEIISKKLVILHEEALLRGIVGK